ncbi:MAG: hypothetical protein FWE75_24925, partial [Actinomycetia bacterium]|nr:hypothetical protein [Actinomycetes bacterium]
PAGGPGRPDPRDLREAHHGREAFDGRDAFDGREAPHRQHGRGGHDGQDGGQERTLPGGGARG